MAWTDPPTYTTGQIISVSLMNEISNNLKRLKGTDGTVPIDAGITASGVVAGTAGLNTPGRISGGSALNLAGIATVGGVVSSAAISGATHVTVSGIGTFQAGVVTATHVSAGGNIAVLSGKTVDGVDISDWGPSHMSNEQTVHGASCIGSAHVAALNQWSYTGNGAPNQEVNHGLGRVPCVVIIQCAELYSGYAEGMIFASDPTTIYYHNDFKFTKSSSVTAMNTSSFYVGNAGNYDWSMNLSDRLYYWTAIG